LFYEEVPRMGFVLRFNGAVVLILTSTLLWGGIAWAVPENRLNEELGSTTPAELPSKEQYPPTLVKITYGEILPPIFHVAAAGETWTCVSCSAENPAEAKYCSQCGAKRGEAAAAGLPEATICPKCGFVNEKGARFCGDCGYGFSAAGARTAELELVYVPGRGYIPKGTMIEPGRGRRRNRNVIDQAGGCPVLSRTLFRRRLQHDR
jgi:ribosomal protein L40E